MATLAAQSAPAATPLDTYDYIAGTQVFGSAYHFTDQSLLIEGSGQLVAMGSNMIKCALGPSYLKKGYVNQLDADIQSDTQLAQQKEYKQLFNMPFSRYFLWTYAYSTRRKIFPLHGPIPPDVLNDEYKEIYDLTRYLLTTYNGTGKTFYLGNWEGDWHLLDGVPGRSDPALKATIDPLPGSTEAMASWLNARQHAIDDAKRDTPHKDIQVWFYVEANLVQKSIKENRVSLARDVLPFVNPDYVSYSAYDSTNPDKDLHHDLPVALDYLQSKLKPKPGLPEKRVFLGEFGEPTLHLTPLQQDARVRDVLATAIQWGTPFALYWELYNNELEPDGTQRGFWLIDDKNVKQPVYYTFQSYYADAKAYVAAFTKDKGRPPNDQEFHKFAYNWFRGPVAAKLDTYDYIAGTQVFSSSYHFTDQPLLVEGAEQIHDMGSNMIKFILGPSYVKNRGGKKDPNINSLTDLAQDAEYKKVFDMPFSRYFMWVYSFSTNGKIFPLHGPIASEVLDQEYKEVYALTKYMLTTYSGTGKTFYFGSWEGDWQLIAGAKPEIKDMEMRRVIDPLPDSPQAMASWASTRQRAIDAAKRDTPHNDVQIWYYLETNMVQKSIKEGRVSVASDVVPLVNPDFVSYSAYDSTDPDKDLHNDLPKALDYMQSKLKPKPGLPTKRVFVGEFGAPTLHYTPQQQDARVRDVMATAIQWGTPFVLYWQLYNNELEPNGTPRGFWLIDDKGVKQPVYYTLQKYYADSKAYVGDFTKKNNRQPDDQEFGRFAYQWFSAP